MKLISDIINELVDSEKSISSPLLKTKVLASRLGNEELLNWVNQQLNGYPESQEIPKNRTFGCHLIGDYVNGRMQYTSQPVPIGGIDPVIEERLTSIEFLHSIAALENIVKGDKTGSIDMPLSSDIVGYLQSHIQGLGNRYFHLVNARKFISINCIVEILALVRNQLLDFMLKLDHEFGDLTEIEDLKTKQNEIKQFMNQTIINNSGDGNILNAGDNSNISAKINIAKGNKDDLKSELSKIGVEEAESAELLVIIDDESPSFENKQFGRKVNQWIQKMIGKSLDGTWQVSIGVAGTLLAEVLMKYYGM